MGAFEVSLTYALVEVGAFLLEAVENPAGQRDALACHIEWQVEKQGQIGLQVPVHPMFELLKFRPVEPTPSSLIGIGRVAEAVADHPLPLGKRWFDNLRQMFTPRGKHQQGFGFEVHRRMEQQFPELFTQFRTAGFARDMDDLSLLAQQFGKPLDVAALASAVDAFEGYEFSSHLPPFWYLLTALLCSSSVRENWLLPSPRATKYSTSLLAGWSAAWIAASPGMAIGDGGNPLRV